MNPAENFKSVRQFREKNQEPNEYKKTKPSAEEKVSKPKRTGVGENRMTQAERSAHNEKLLRELLKRAGATDTEIS